MIPGVAISMGGTEFLVPPLTLGQLRRLMPKIRELTAIDIEMGDPQINIVCEIVATALQRNYPEMTPEAVEDLLDLGNSNAVLSAILTGSGLRRGEAEAVAKLNGAGSTVYSPPHADTPIP